MKKPRLNFVFLGVGLVLLITQLKLMLDGPIGFSLAFLACFFILLALFWKQNPVKVMIELLFNTL
ncbi:hypothetical protein [Amphibacillus jilinensis]|uniref:hypothetical protein n=1 Tax=Amphibacillus jilinensis TaxID=1216008 RepID=UPI000304B563|nr:hypothetical protein [Amphibacillus jilinensis]